MDDLIERIPFSLKVYGEGDISGLDLKELKNYVQDKTSLQVFVRGNIYDCLSKDQVQMMGQKLARLRIKDPTRGTFSKKPLEGEITYEKERIIDRGWKSFGILYEGVLYQELLREFILNGKLCEQNCKILLTNQLIGTWDQDELRYHIRTSLYGFPNIISIPGLVLAPAKPREFYIKRQMGIPVEILKEEYKGRFLDHGDSRMTEVLKGYVMQALFYHLMGNPFCEDRDCRLFNSHWQEEMLHAQLNGKYEFCQRHEGLLNKIKNRKRNGQSP